MSTLPDGPTESEHANASGDTAVSPASQLHTAIVTFSGGATARTVSVDASQLSVGALVDVVAVWAAGAANGMAVTIRNANGTQLFTFSRDGDEANALFSLRCSSTGGLRAIQQVIPAYPTL